MTSIIVSYWPSRRKYLDGIIEPMKKLGEVIVWNNWNEPIEGAINSNENHHSRVRYIASILSKDDILYFQDDDIFVTEQTIKDMTNHPGISNGAIVGLFGKKITSSSLPYTTAQEVNEGEADIILGRAFAMNKHTLMRLLPSLFLRKDVRQEDDIITSLENVKQGFKNYVVNSSGWHGVDEEREGYFYQPEHMERRNNACKLYV